MSSKFTRRGALGLMAGAIAAPNISRADPNATLKFVPSADPGALDPVYSTAGVVQNHSYAVFDTLFGLNGASQVRPQMAEGHTVSDDRLTWSIRLREGLRFHDGEPVLAKDCVASLRRWAKKDAFGQLLDAATAEWIAHDDRTIRIRLHRPFPHLLDALAKPSIIVPFMMPERLALTDPSKQISEVIGSGPFRFVSSERVAGSRLVYQRFDGYVPRSEQPDWGSGGKVAHVDRVEWQVLPDAATAAAALQAGEVDWWETAHADLVPLLRRSKGVNIGVINPVGFLAIMRFNVLNAPFDKPAMRRAMMRGIVQEDYLGTLTSGEAGTFKECRSLFPCGTPFENERFGADLKAPLDAAGLKEAFRAAGYQGEKIVIFNPADLATIAPMGRITADWLQRAGCDVDLQEMDWGSVSAKLQSKSPIDKGGWSMLHTWFSAHSIGSPAVNVLTRGQGEQGWLGWYGSERAESLATEWLQAEDPARAKQIADQIQEQTFTDAPTIPLGTFLMQTAYRQNITGVLPGIAPYFWNVRKG